MPGNNVKVNNAVKMRMRMRMRTEIDENKFGEMLSENTLDDLKSSLTSATDKITNQTNVLKENQGEDLYDKIKIGLIILKF